MSQSDNVTSPFGADVSAKQASIAVRANLSDSLRGIVVECEAFLGVLGALNVVIAKILVEFCRGRVARGFFWETNLKKNCYIE